jgi:hypothetical protein
MPCSVCKAFCFLSFVQCDACAAANGGKRGSRRRGRAGEEEDEEDAGVGRRGEALCLDHLDHLCDCGVSENITLYYRFTIEELTEVTKRYERHLRRLHRKPTAD